VILNATARPRFRPRMNSEHPMYYDSYGRLLVPAGPAVGINSLGGQHHHRSSSMTGRPAQIVINNELRDEHHEGRGERERDRRPRSSHFHDFEVVARDRTRSRSRVRIRERDVVRDRTPSPYYEYEQSFETREKLKKLEEYEKKQEEAAHKKRLEEEMFIKAAKEAAEAAAHKKEEEELKKKAIAEWQAKEAEEKEKAKKKQEEEDKAFGEKMRKTMWANGFSDEQIERMIKKAEKKEKGGGDWGESSGSGHKHQPQPTVVTSGVLALNRPTFIKVHRKHIDPDTLDFYQLPWEWDPASSLSHPLSRSY
jgi:hypothetical protein